MAVASVEPLTVKGSAPPRFALKSAALTLVAVVLQTANLEELEQDLESRLQETPGLFTGDPVVIDLTSLQIAPRDVGLDGFAEAAVETGAAQAGSPVPAVTEPSIEPFAEAPIDFVGLIELLERYKISPIAVKGGSVAQMQAAQDAGLIEAPATALVREGKKGKGKQAQAETEPAAREVVKEVVREVVREVPAAGSAAITMRVDKPLRSGQQVYARGGDLVVLAVVNVGAEVIADGSIHVYAPLRGKAIAGAKGDTEARIFTTCLEAELISIAGVYRTGEHALPPEVLGKPAQIRLQGDKLVMEPLET